MYDFEGIDIVELKERASQLEDSQKGLKKKVNPKVMNMIDKWVSSVLCQCVRRVDINGG
jgi:hypothetical protein